MYLGLITPYIGASSELVPQVVEKGAIRRFAIASMETNPLYYDEEYAKTTPYGTIIAPPTFARALFYPKVLPVEDKILPQRGRVHGSQTFKHLKPIKAGDTVYCRTTLISAREKTGHSGYMLFVTWEQAILDENGDAYTLGYCTTVYKEAMLKNTDPLRFQSWFPQIPSDSWLEGLSAAVPEKVNVGDKIGPIHIPEITRLWISQWAGATGDYNPIHVDSDKAKETGMDDVIAHGMLSLGVATRVFGAWLGNTGFITESTTKFSAPVRPGDHLTMEATVSAVTREDGKTTAEWEYAVKNAAGKDVLLGTMGGVLAL